VSFVEDAVTIFLKNIIPSRKYQKKYLKGAIMTAKLSAEEKTIIEYVEGNEASSIDDAENEKNRYKQIAITQMSKKKAISIRLLESDIDIKAKSLSQGLPIKP